MNKHRHAAAKPPRRKSTVSRQLFRQYVLVFLLFCVVSVAVPVAVLLWSQSFIWHGDEPLYPVLYWVSQNFWILFPVFLLGGSAVISGIYMKKALRYVDEVVAASKQMVSQEKTPIALPEKLKSVEVDLNFLREQSFRRAMEAKEAEQRKNDLIVYLAHDLKTPLTSVIGYLTLLRDEPQISPALQEKYLGIACRKAERLEDLINELFDITRFSLTRLTLETENIHFTRMIEQIAYEFQPVLSEKELSWDLRLEPEVHLVCDPDKMQRVLDNLIRNAVNYSYPQTDILLQMRVVQDKVEIFVKNHGKTIPKEKLDRIFEQFFRLDSSRASTTGGAGLGLAIVKEIVELHGGTISAESAEESIAFTIALPYHCQKTV